MTPGSESVTIVLEPPNIFLHPNFYVPITGSHISGTLRSWGHFNFQCYLVRTGPMSAFFGSKIISLTILDIIDTNPNDSKTFTPHL